MRTEWEAFPEQRHKDFYPSLAVVRIRTPACGSRSRIVGVRIMSKRFFVGIATFLLMVRRLLTDKPLPALAKGARQNGFSVAGVMPLRMNRPQRLEIAMKSGLLMLLVFSLPFAAQAAKEENVKSDQDKLQGRWEITSDGYYGSQQDTSTTRRLVIVGDTFTFEEDGRFLSRGVFRLEPCQSPQAIDIEIIEGWLAFRQTRSLGIYELSGDNLAWCWAELGSTERPKDFIAHASGPRHNVLTFEREKP
jgi:uncharacterized protein (TIGR03067 family)